MRICMVVTVLAPQGGIEAALVPLVLGLQAQGHDLILCVLQPLTRPNQNLEALERARIQIVTPWSFLTRFSRWVATRRLRLALTLSAALLPAAVVRQHQEAYGFALQCRQTQASQ